jgi:hypothetical protein
VGTEFGLYITLDGGKVWSKFTNNMPAANVHFIELHKKTNDLIVATHGRGIIIIDDVSILRQMTEENMNKELYFFKTKPTTIVETNGFGGASTETQFIGENPSRSAKIMYYLKKRHTLGKMSLEIQDASGNKITELGPSKSKGINTVEWNYNTRPPKMATAKTFAFGGFASPRVPAGTYKVVIQKGKETFTNDLVIQYDAKSDISLADRKLQEATTKKLFDMSEELAYMVYTLDEYLKLAETAKAKGSQGAKIAAPLISDLTKLKETLVVTKGDNYVGTAEPQLREKMAELYAKIASSFYKPNQAELSNLEVIESRFTTAKNDYTKIKDKNLNKVTSFLAKDGLQLNILKTKEEFLRD